jgi:hypothetical protein
MVGQAMSTEVKPSTLAEELAALVPLALQGLSQMQDPESGLFSHKARVGPDGELTNQGVNPLYTAACAVGLLSVPEGRGHPYAGQADRALDALTRVEQDEPAVLGTALWACVSAGSGQASRLAEALIDQARPRRWSSMQLGLALAGLSRWLRANDAGDGSTAARTARALAAELERRYVPQAHVFAAAGTRRQDPFGLTSFASQVYPILGLCDLATATSTAPSSVVGHVCDFLVRAQGQLGQWWWFYSTRRAAVIDGYPVYSVHQDAMAIMALLPAGRFELGDYEKALTAGVRWIWGANELDRCLVNSDAAVIYRAVQRAGGDADGFAGWSRRQRGAASLAAMSGHARRAPARLEVLTECRSYHLGWLLLAAAMAAGA